MHRQPDESLQSTAAAGRSFADRLERELADSTQLEARARRALPNF
jgi:hypothetical protein